MLSLHIRRLVEIDRDLAEIEAATSVAMRPFAAQRVLLTTIPGVDELAAAAIITEIGVAMTVFGTAQRLAAWAGVGPANHEARGRESDVAPLTAAVSASQAKGTYLRDKFHCLKARMGTKGGYGRGSQNPGSDLPHAPTRHRLDLGGDYLDSINKHRTAKRLARRLDLLGYGVTLRPQAAASPSWQINIGWTTI
jgi:hypothetical protein